MKKITLLFVVLFVTISVQLTAQNCTPDHTGYTVVPDTGIMLPRPLPFATVNVAYQQAVTIGVPSVVVYNGMNVPLNWLQVDSVASKNGNIWTVVNSTGGNTYSQWTPLSWQCVTLMGTPTHLGVDSITVFVNAQIVAFSIPLTVNKQVGGKLALTVQAPQAIGAEYMDNNISVFPNPSANGVYSLAVDQSFEMTICDITGRIISTSLINAGTIDLNLTNETSGIYFVRLKNDYYSKVVRLVRK